MRIYISGPITGREDGNRAAFAQAERQLRAAGFTPINPHDNGLPADTLWHEHMRRDLALLLECDGVALLDEWDQSRGARIEYALARDVGLPRRIVQHWIEDAPPWKRQALPTEAGG